MKCFHELSYKGCAQPLCQHAGENIERLEQQVEEYRKALDHAASCPLIGRARQIMKDKYEKIAACLGCRDALLLLQGTEEKRVEDKTRNNYFCLDPKCTWQATDESRPLSRGTKVGCPVCKGDADFSLTKKRV